MRIKLSVKWNTELAIAWLFLTPQINYYLANILDMYGMPTITPLIYLMAAILGILSYGQTLKTKQGMLFTWTLVVLVIVSAFVNDQTTKYMFDSNVLQSGLILLLFLYFPVFLLLQQQIDFKRLMNYLWKGSLITLCFAVGAFCKLVSFRNDRTFDYMSFAYMMLSPIMICLIQEWQKKRVQLVLPIAASVVLFVIGCRGAAVALAFFLVVCFLDLYFRGGRTVRHLFVKLIMVIGAVLIGLNLNSIMKKMVILLDSFGFSSRTLEALLLGKGLFIKSIKSDGRQSIWKQAIDNIGIMGKGLFGDRTVILDEYHHPVYPHNFILEVMVDFGMVIGSILVISFIILVIKAVFKSYKSNDMQKIQMTYAMLTILLIKHMVSASFLTSFDFWFYIGLAMNLIIYSNDCLKSVPQQEE